MHFFQWKISAVLLAKCWCMFSHFLPPSVIPVDIYTVFKLCKLFQTVSNCPSKQWFSGNGEEMWTLAVRGTAGRAEPERQTSGLLGWKSASYECASWYVASDIFRVVQGTYGWDAGWVQDHRIIEVGSDPLRSRNTILLVKAGSTSAGWPGLCLVRF